MRKRLVKLYVDDDLHARLYIEAIAQGKTVSSYGRQLLQVGMELLGCDTVIVDRELPGQTAITFERG